MSQKQNKTKLGTKLWLLKCQNVVKRLKAEWGALVLSCFCSWPGTQEQLCFYSALLNVCAQHKVGEKLKEVVKTHLFCICRSGEGVGVCKEQPRSVELVESVCGEVNDRSCGQGVLPQSGGSIYDHGHSMFPFNHILNLKTADYCLCKLSVKG